MGKAKRRRYTFEELAAVAKSIQQGMATHLPAEEEVRVRGTPETAAHVAADFQAFVDQHAATEAAKTAAQTAVADRRKSKREMELRLAQFTNWASARYGAAGYGMFGLRLPRDHVVPPTSRAVGIIKRLATLAVQKAAQESIAPAEESLVVVGKDGKPIGPPSKGKGRRKK